MQERYRKDYDGEFVILNTEYKDGKKIQHREWIENPIENEHISGRAVIIGNGSSRVDFPIHHLQGHKGGLLGRKRLQSYGTQGCWRELQTDFYVEVDSDELEKIKDSGYQEKVIVYTGTKNCIKYPGEFYLVPYNTKLQTIALATWIAAFDNHKEIFLIGVDGMDLNNVLRKKEIQDLTRVMSAYSSTNFIMVNDGKNIPDLWRNCVNFRLMDYQTFISNCDV